MQNIPTNLLKVQFIKVDKTYNYYFNNTIMIALRSYLTIYLFNHSLYDKFL